MSGALLFPIAHDAKSGPLCGMGAKYTPSIKDQKATQRFQQKQHVQSKFIKPSGKPAMKKKSK